MKNTKVPKVQILSQNFKIRGDLGQTSLASLAFPLGGCLNHLGACYIHGFPHWRVFMRSRNLHLKSELRMVLELQFENY